MLYRGTPDNPALMVDARLAAAVMSVAVGPSGRNDAYLLSLDEFLTAHNESDGSSNEVSGEDHSRDDATGELARMVKMLQAELRPYFLVGAGSNEHGQLLLDGGSGASSIREAHETSEVLLVVPRDEFEEDEDHEPASLHAGGGHTALLTEGGRLHLWGWNGAGQLGREDAFLEDDAAAGAGCSFDVVPPLDLTVAAADLGHNHTVVIECHIEGNRTCILLRRRRPGPASRLDGGRRGRSDAVVVLAPHPCRTRGCGLCRRRHRPVRCSTRRGSPKAGRL